MPRIIAVIQARMGSSRLPGKVLLDLGGQPMLARVVERVRRAHSLNDVLVATTSEAQDDRVAEFCQALGTPVYRGSDHDVLDRFYQAARICEAEAIVRITADCPVIDPVEVDHTVGKFLRSGSDFTTNRLPPPWHRTYPIGLDTEVCTFNALERAWKEADQAFQREHVMPYFYEGIPIQDLNSRKDAKAVSPRGFLVLVLNHDPDYGSLRWTVDTPEDLELMRKVYLHFEGRDDFSWLDVLGFFEQRPDLVNTNSGIQPKTVFDVDHRWK